MKVKESDIRNQSCCFKDQYNCGYVHCTKPMFYTIFRSEMMVSQPESFITVLITCTYNFSIYIYSNRSKFKTEVALQHVEQWVVPMYSLLHDYNIHLPNKALLQTLYRQLWPTQKVYVKLFARFSLKSLRWKSKRWIGLRLMQYLLLYFILLF